MHRINWLRQEARQVLKRWRSTDPVWSMQNRPWCLIHRAPPAPQAGCWQAVVVSCWRALGSWSPNAGTCLPLQNKSRRLCTFRVDRLLWIPTLVLKMSIDCGIWSWEVAGYSRETFISYHLDLSVLLFPRITDLSIAISNPTKPYD